MLAAKAIQDFPLYNGQEVSTRYVDFRSVRLENPLKTEAGTGILEGWRSFYLRSLEQMISVLKARHPKGDGEDEKVWEKAVKARAFDIMRAFLPAGATTNVAWMGTLRQFADRLPILRHHPLAEVRDIGETVEKALIKAFPNSFSDKRYPATEEYLRTTVPSVAYFLNFEITDRMEFHEDMLRHLLHDFRDVMLARPPKVELPYAVRDAGTMLFDFLLDFGSFRDIQRQRAVSIRMPLLTMEHGFEPWYLRQLSDELREKAERMLETQQEHLYEMEPEMSPDLMQYYIPMGYRVPVRLAGDLRGVVYLVELRSGSTVHPTLRVRAQEMAECLQEAFGENLVLHIDREPDRFNMRRGEHDIVEKD
jgi:thymidylate synthase ThyX